MFRTNPDSDSGSARIFLANPDLDLGFRVPFQEVVQCEIQYDLKTSLRYLCEEIVLFRILVM